jgi:hypothetical protein
MATEDRLREIRQRISTVTATRARAQVEYENAQTRVASARADLKERFGVVTTEDAKRVQRELEEDLERQIEAVEAALTEAGA